MDTKKEQNIPSQSSTKHWNSQEIYQNELAHMVSLAKQPGWKSYVWDQAKRLDADPCGLWKGIKDDLVKEMTNGTSKESV